MQPSPGTRLDSWKVIADYVDRDVRTVTRWANERGLPVHRVPGGKRGSVFAFSTEIDAWLLGQNGASLGPNLGQHNGNGSGKGTQLGQGAQTFPEQVQQRPASPEMVPQRSHIWRLALPIVIAATATAGLSFALRTRSPGNFRLVSLQYGLDQLEGKSADGRTIWVHKFPRLINETDFGGAAVYGYDLARVSDYFGDGRREAAAIIPTRPGADPSDGVSTELDFFTETGKLLWRYAPNRGFRFGNHELRGPWLLLDTFVSETPGRQAIWASASHYMWGNSFVVRIDPRTGQDALRFVNTGQLRRLKELKTNNGTYLLAAGFNNEWDSGSLAIFNEDRAFAASPQSEGSRHKCDSCPAGAPDYYFVFPRSELNRVAGVYEDSVDDIVVSDEGIEVLKQEGSALERQATYYLLSREAPFRVLSLRYNSDYDMLHRKWSASGKITHTLEDCPERAHPQAVRLWTPATGWTNLPVKPAGANQ